MLSRLFTADSFVLVSRRRWATSPLNSRRLGYLCIALMMLAGVLMRRAQPHFWLWGADLDYLPDWGLATSGTNAVYENLRLSFGEPRFLLPLVAGLWLIHEMLRKHYTGELDELMLTGLTARDFIWCTSGELTRWFALRMLAGVMLVHGLDLFLLVRHMSPSTRWYVLEGEGIVALLRVVEMMALIGFTSIVMWWLLLRHSDPLFMLRDLVLLCVGATFLSMLMFGVWEELVAAFPRTLGINTMIAEPGYGIRDPQFFLSVPLIALTLLWGSLAWLSFRWLEPMMFELYRE